MGSSVCFNYVWPHAYHLKLVCWHRRCSLLMVKPRLREVNLGETSRLRAISYLGVMYVVQGGVPGNHVEVVVLKHEGGVLVAEGVVSRQNRLGLGSLRVEVGHAFG